MSQETKIHLITAAIQSTLAMLILSALTWYSMIRWNEATSAMLIMGTVQLLIEIVRQFSGIKAEINREQTTQQQSPKPTP